MNLRGPGGLGWRSFAAGALAGLAAGWLARRRGEGPSASLPAARAVGSAVDAVEGVASRAIEGVREGLSGVRTRWADPRPLDLERAEAVVAEHAEEADVRVVALGDGILEVVGTVRDESVAKQVLAELSEVSGVEVVVNRLWTPSSSRSPASRTRSRD